jgi:hypothetical protein
MQNNQPVAYGTACPIHYICGQLPLLPLDQLPFMISQGPNCRYERLRFVFWSAGFSCMRFFEFVKLLAGDEPHTSHFFPQEATLTIFAYPLL